MANVALPTNAVDLEGLDALRRRAHREDPSALAEVAVQFEALFIGMMLESARSASLGGGLFDGAETGQYLALMDRQLAHLVRLVDDLLDLPRVSRGIIELKTEPPDIAGSISA